MSVIEAQHLKEKKLEHVKTCSELIFEKSTISISCTKKCRENVFSGHLVNKWCLMEQGSQRAGTECRAVTHSQLDWQLRLTVCL